MARAFNIFGVLLLLSAAVHLATLIPKAAKKRHSTRSKCNEQDYSNTNEGPWLDHA